MSLQLPSKEGQQLLCLLPVCGAHCGGALPEKTLHSSRVTRPGVLLLLILLHSSSGFLLVYGQALKFNRNLGRNRFGPCKVPKQVWERVVINPPLVQFFYKSIQILQQNEVQVLHNKRPSIYLQIHVTIFQINHWISKSFQ